MAVLDALPTAHAESGRRPAAQPEPRSSASSSRRGDSAEPRRDQTAQPATDLYASLEGALASAAIMPQQAAAGLGPQQPPVASLTTPAAPLVAANVRASASAAAPAMQTAQAVDQPTGAKLVAERTFHALVSPTLAAVIAEGAAMSGASTPSAPAPASAQAVAQTAAASGASTPSAIAPASALVLAPAAAASKASTPPASAPVSTPFAARPQDPLSRTAAASGSNGRAAQGPADPIHSREVDAVVDLGSPSGRDAAPPVINMAKDQAADAVSTIPSSAIAASQAPSEAQAQQVDPSRQANASTNETPRATDRPSLSAPGQANAARQPDAPPASPLSARPAVAEKDGSRAAGSRRAPDAARAAPSIGDLAVGQTFQPQIDASLAAGLSAAIAQAPSDPSPSPVVSTEARPAPPAAASAPSHVREIDLDLSSGGLENVSMTMRLAGERMSVLIRAGSSQTASAIESARSAIADRLAAIGQPLGSLIIQQTNATADGNATANRSEGGDAEGRHEPKERSGGDSSDPRGYRRGSSGS